MTFFEKMNDEPEHPKDDYYNAWQYFKWLYGIDWDKIKSVAGNIKQKELIFPTFEDALGIIEQAIMRNESFSNPDFHSSEGTIDKTRVPLLRHIREELKYLIAEVLQKTLKNTNKYHENLINKIEDNLDLTAFISLNYDIIIDNVLINWVKAHNTFKVDYGITFDNFYPLPTEENPFRDPWRFILNNESNTVTPIYLFKLHGSLNWLYCPSCITLNLHWDIAGERTIKSSAESSMGFDLGYSKKSHRCRACKHNLSSILIPPTFFKQLSNYYLQKIWHQTWILLNSINKSSNSKIIFCGYSLPEADFHIKYLLKRVEIRRGNLPKIFLVNKNQDREPNYGQDYENYRRFFKKSLKIIDTGLSFQEFCDKERPLEELE